MSNDSQLKTKADLHLARKLWHILGVTTILVIYHNVSRPTALQLITFFAFMFISVDVLRLQFPWINRLVLSGFQPIMRDSEKDAIAGTTYLFLGVFILILFFPKTIVMLSLMFLGLADPLASFVGVKFGKDKLIRSKSLQGTLAAFVCCVTISAIFFYNNNLMTERLLLVSILAGVIGACAELIPIWKLDDNFTIPVLSSFMLWVLFSLFGGF